MKKYINETLIGGVHGVAWYHTFYQKNPGQMSDYNNKILGVVHIRQHRVANNSCPNPERAKELNTTCASEFGFIYQRSFGERWHPGTYYFIEYRRLEHFWHYRRSGPMILGKLLILFLQQFQLYLVEYENETFIANYSGLSLYLVFNKIFSLLLGFY